MHSWASRSTHSPGCAAKAIRRRSGAPTFGRFAHFKVTTRTANLGRKPGSVMQATAPPSPLKVPVQGLSRRPCDSRARSQVGHDVAIRPLSLTRRAAASTQTPTQGNHTATGRHSVPLFPETTIGTIRAAISELRHIRNMGRWHGWPSSGLARSPARDKFQKALRLLGAEHREPRGIEQPDLGEH